ncbi:MAG: hypothetical protein ACRC18_06290, partial [Cetobacterium sp.]
ASLENGSVFKNMDEEMQKAFSGIRQSLDFTDIKTEDQLLEVEMSLNNLLKACANGDVDINNISKALENANKEFAKSGDAEKYSKNIDKIISDLEKATGKDFSMLKDVFEGMDTSILKGKDALDEFLRAYGKTKSDLDNNDGFAKALANQKRQIEQTIEELNSVSGDAEIDLELAYNIINNNELPGEIRDMVRVLINKGNNSTEVVQFAQELLVDISDGNINVDDANKKIEEKFGEGAFEITPDILLSDSTKVAGVETVIKQLTDKFGEIPPVVKTVIEAEGVTAYNSANEIRETYEGIPKEVRTVMSTNGTETLADIININNMLGVLPQNIVMDILTNFPEVIQGAGSVEEIISSLPPSVLMEIQSNYPEVVEGSKAIQDAINNIPATKESTVSVKEEVQKNPSGIFDKLFGKNKSNLNATATVTTQVNNAKALTDVEDKIKRLTANGKAVQLKADATDVDKKTKDSQKKVDDIKQKSPAKINVDNVSANNRLKTTKGHLDEIKSKSVSVTVNTNYKTTGTKPPEAPKVGRAVPMTYDVTPIVQSSEINANEISLLSNTPQVLDSASAPSPMPRGYSDPLETFKYGLNHYIELENQLKKISSQLSIIDEKAKNAFGEEKINYLNQQIDLLSQQKRIQEQLSSEYKNQQQALKNNLSSHGILFDSNGNISNYHSKLVAMNKEYDRLNDIAKSANEASSSYKGDNDGERDRLSNASKVASENASKYKDSLDELKKKMDEYLSLTFDDIPKAQEEWEKLNSSINDTKDSIEELHRNQALFSHQNQVTELEYEYDKLADKIDLIDEKIKNAYGQDKLRLIEQQISLMKQQQDIQKNLIDSYQKQAEIYRNDLSKYGFKFDGEGDVTNIDETLNSFKNHEDLEKVKKLLEDYIKIQRDELPDAAKEWEKLNSAIKDAYKDQLDITKNMEDEITKIYKEQVEKRKKLIDEELKKRLDALDKEKKAYQDYRDEVDYQNDYEDQLKKINDLQAEYDKLSGDNSLGSKKKLEELLKQIEEENKKLEGLVQDKIDNDINDMFDKENDRLEQEAEDAKDQLDKDFSDEKIQELVKSALNTGVFESIDGTMRSLQDVMLEFCDEYGEGLSVIGNQIKNEMIANLEIAKDTMKELANIMKELDLNQYSYSMGRMSTSSIPDMSRYISSNSNTQTVQFNSPLINIEGNVDQGVMSNLESMEGRIVDKVCKEIISKTNGR